MLYTVQGKKLSHPLAGMPGQGTLECVNGKDCLVPELTLKLPRTPRPEWASVSRGLYTKFLGIVYVPRAAPLGKWERETNKNSWREEEEEKQQQQGWSLPTWDLKQKINWCRKWGYILWQKYLWKLKITSWLFCMNHGNTCTMAKPLYILWNVDVYDKGLPYQSSRMESWRKE